jgi:hypothetical protein
MANTKNSTDDPAASSAALPGAFFTKAESVPK